MASSPTHAENPSDPNGTPEREMLEIDPNTPGADSAIQTGDADSTFSITSDVLRPQIENGRAYHGFQKEATWYPLPNDDTEMKRLDLMHHLWRSTFPKPLFLNPEKTFGRVLDIGTGTGIWAIDFADAYPESEVIGVDISPMQPEFVPPNVRFEIDNLDDPWTFSRKFDFIFCRSMIGSIKDWDGLLGQVFQFLNPGGWFEYWDHSYPLKGNEEDFEKTSIFQWSKYILDAAASSGQPIDGAPQFQGRLKRAGFINVDGRKEFVPIGGWAKDSKLKEIGRVAAAMFTDNIEGISRRLFVDGLRWTEDDVTVFSAAVRRDMKDPSIHAYSEAYAAWGQKPPDAGS
ncbi:S-adenosyl-L-methionine-dependent methyltransferase [Plectosphaerella cucumerina]|uniref:S-adenosyl-L-methionine-dependent methyltransferase n=1 Tax=Plectosphaerella cucumerina TaxID=40658 RepID=A0A8K0TVC2_9PEZI|nr:S-adenosyl-L-methionine-dependent methyltransferase [Plectosphaerella cucumerina]